MKAFILAGGEGSRLRPVTYEIPKPLLPVKKKPIINYLVDLFARHGVLEFVVSISEKHQEDFMKWKKEHYADERIDFSVEREPLGTFGSLMLVKDRFADEPFFMTNGDELKKFDLDKMRSAHAESGATATVGLVRVNDPQHYGVAICNGSKIETFIEKPKHPPTSYINAGIYLFEPGVFAYYPHQEIKFAMVERDLFPALAKEGALGRHKF